MELIDFSITHPRFTHAKFVVQGHDRLMQTTLGTDDKQYQRWKSTLPKGPEAESFLLLPVR